jgi:RHS repeat-associated protein
LLTVTYNDKHEVLTSTDAAGQATTYTYYPEGQIHTVTNAKGERVTYVYDGDGRLLSVTGPQGSTTSYTYDGYGRQRTSTEPNGHTLTVDYDALDRITRATYPDGTYEEVAYDKLDAVGYRDRLGRWTHTFYDALRRPVAARDAAGRTMQKNEWVSCPSGCGGGGAKLSKLVDGNGNATTWEYDLQGRVTNEVGANGAEYVQTYENTTNRLKSVLDPNGNVKTYSYNRDDTLAGITYQPAQGVAATPNVSFTYDPHYNRVATMTDGTGTTTYAYYPAGVLGAGKLQSVDGPLGNDTIEYEYDELGRLTTRQIGGAANTETVQYDSLGRTTTLTNPLGAFSYGYDGVTGHPASITYPNGQVTTYAFTDVVGDLRLREIHNKKPGGATLSRFEHTYDVLGKMKTWRQQTDTDPPKVYEFGYDAAGELTAAMLKSTDPTPVLLKRYYYAYDSAANRTAEQIDDAVRSWTYNNMNHLATEAAGGALIFKGTVNEPATVTVGGKPATVTADNRFTGAAVVAPSGATDVQVTATDYASPTRNTRTNTYRVSQTGTPKSFTFDANGNLVGDGTRTYEWDAADRLTAIVQGSSRTEFTYDGRGRRVRLIEKLGGGTVSDSRFLWCEERLCERRDALGGTVLDRFFADGAQLAGTNYYNTRDHLGSVREVIDASGTLRARYDYDPFGRATTTSGDVMVPFRYTGHQLHVGSDLLLTRTRTYDPMVARWLSRDPSKDVTSPNLYAYVENDPINYWDPDGRAGEGAAAGTIGQLCKRVAGAGIGFFSMLGIIAAIKCLKQSERCNKDTKERCDCLWKDKPPTLSQHGLYVSSEQSNLLCRARASKCCSDEFERCRKRWIPGIGKIMDVTPIDCLGEMPPCTPTGGE